MLQSIYLCISRLLSGFAALLHRLWHPENKVSVAEPAHAKGTDVVIDVGGQVETLSIDNVMPQPRLAANNISSEDDTTHIMKACSLPDVAVPSTTQENICVINIVNESKNPSTELLSSPESQRRLRLPFQLLGLKFLMSALKLCFAKPTASTFASFKLPMAQIYSKSRNSSTFVFTTSNAGKW